jgi:hypothetical protein
MNQFCNTHVWDRTRAELEERLRDLDARDLSKHPGLQAERARVAEALSHVES